MTINPLNITTTGLPIFNTSTGNFAAVALTTKGDLLVHNGTNYTRLPVGNNGEIVKADSAQSTGLLWENLTFTGDLIMISRQTASSSSSITFTDLDTTTYGTFFINLVDIHPSSDNVNLRCLFSTDNGSSFLNSGYAWVYKIIDASSASDSENHGTAQIFIDSADQIGNSGGEGIAGWFWYLPSNNPSTGTKQTIEWQLYGQDDSTDLKGYWGGGTNSTSTAIDAIRFQFSSGNIESGDIYLYGLSAS